jgi:hypothetical protein
MHPSIRHGGVQMIPLTTTEKTTMVIRIDGERMMVDALTSIFLVLKREQA